VDGGAWWAAVHGVAKSRIGLSDYRAERLHFHFSLSCIGEGNGNPLQCSCLENPRDGGAWWAAVSGVAQSRTRLKQLSSSSSLRKNSLKSLFSGNEETRNMCGTQTSIPTISVQTSWITFKGTDDPLSLKRQILK